MIYSDLLYNGSLQVLFNVNSEVRRFVTPCDGCHHLVRFPIIVPCPNIHLLCTECLINASRRGNAFTRRLPLIKCPLCFAAIHADFFDRLQPPVQTRQLFVVKNRAERRKGSQNPINRNHRGAEYLVRKLHLFSSWTIIQYLFVRSLP